MNQRDVGFINQKYLHKQEVVNTLKDELKEDIIFYKKRIYQSTKELIHNKFVSETESIENAFLNYAKLLIDNFKLDDTKELLNENNSLETIYEDVEDEETCIDEIKTSEEITKQLLISNEKSSIIRIEDCFNIVKKENPHIIEAIKKRRPESKINVNEQINLKQDKFREKGVKKSKK